MKWIAALCSDENSRADEMAILSILSVLVFLGLSIFAVVWRHQPWTPIDYGVGVGSVIGAACAGMGLKKRLGA
jgi:hypothetical protein